MNVYDNLIQLAAIHETQQEMETAECYIRGKLTENAGEESGSVFLVCERSECRFGSGNTAIDFQQQMPDGVLPEYMVLMRAKHLATHTDIPPLCTCLTTGSMACGGPWCDPNCLVCNPDGD